MERIIQSIKAKDGIYATLGNHDTCEMVEPFEEMGITLLANETITLQKQKDMLVVTGIDDPHYYFSSQVIPTLSEPSEGFKILLVHTPELYDIAADKGYRLYLCGHTHGGQICLPGGIPIITHTNFGKEYYRGLWRYNKMLGYTNSGCGSVGIPVRFNSPGEIAIIRLKKSGYHRSGTVKRLPR
jgi:predicted MPP superfamily phosphohydrolase